MDVREEGGLRRRESDCRGDADGTVVIMAKLMGVNIWTLWLLNKCAPDSTALAYMCLLAEWWSNGTWIEESWQMWLVAQYAPERHSTKPTCQEILPRKRKESVIDLLGILTDLRADILTELHWTKSRLLVGYVIDIQYQNHRFV